ncbi:MAG: outer membrane beta-barrel protein [Sphingomonadales bacterium]|nr:outer membrane beta-barrel protein [Sphingomonadales bacterium]MBD3775173.1 outer membrane beta-barrel protein [Paracoccaceae bacterium]
MKIKSVALAAAVAAIAISAPAYANETRVEARGGVVWDGGDSDATAGVAAGYDWDLGAGAFGGVEVSADKVLTSNTRVSFGTSARVGAKLDGGTKLYAIGGYQTKPCAGCEDSWTAGAGAEVPFGDKFYGKVEYRHFFVGNGFSDYDGALAGVGIRF